MPDVDGMSEDDFYPELERASGLQPVATVNHPTDWRARLTVKLVKNPITKQVHEQVLSSTANVSLVLNHHPEWEGVLSYDAFAECVTTTRPPPWPDDETTIRTEAQARYPEWGDADTTRLRNWLERVEHIHVGPSDADASVSLVASTSERHPVREYLHSIRWDATQRLHTFLPRYFGSEDTPYTREVGRRWMISAVARALRPGCQVDCVLVFESSQGRRKSTGIEALASSEWFSDTPFVLGDKDAYQSLRGVWIVELAELSGLKRSDVERSKVFLGARKDRYRPSYARRTRDFLRQCVFIGTTNESCYLLDRTGNRRFWPVRISRDVDVEAIRRDRDQLWAEARARYDSGELWYADTAELRAMCEAEQEARVVTDPWEVDVRRWLLRPTERLGDSGRCPLDTSQGISTRDVLVHAIGKRIPDILRADESRIGEALRLCGWSPKRVQVEGVRERRYFPPDNWPTSA